MTARPIIHIGLMKAASTWLQTAVLPTQPGWTYIGLNAGDEVLRAAAWQLAKRDGIQTRRAEATVSAAVRAADGRVVLSNELLAGHPWPIGDAADAAPRDEIAHRLKSIMPRARVVIVLRDFEDWLDSAYDEFLRDGGLSGRRRFRRSLTVHTYADWDELVRVYRDLFDDVVVRDLAQLQHDPDRFVHDLNEALGAAFRIDSESGWRNSRIQGRIRQQVVRLLNGFRPSMIHGRAPVMRIPGAGRVAVRISQTDASRA